MAQHEEKNIFSRRFADRGSDKSVFYSCAREDRFYRNRRSADRGNGMVDRDPRDIIEIKRLRRRVRDLEIQHEIRQIWKRIREIELQQEMRKKTDSRYVVRDDVYEEDHHSDHPTDHFPPRFHVPIYEDKADVVFLHNEEPRYDDDGVAPDEEECLLVREALGDKLPVLENVDLLWLGYNRNDADETIGLNQRSLNKESWNFFRDLKANLQVILKSAVDDHRIDANWKWLTTIMDISSLEKESIDPISNGNYVPDSQGILFENQSHPKTLPMNALEILRAAEIIGIVNSSVSLFNNKGGVQFQKRNTRFMNNILHLNEVGEIPTSQIGARFILDNINECKMVLFDPGGLLGGKTRGRVFFEERENDAG